MPAAEMNNGRRHIATGGVVLYVNRTANIWSRFTSSIPLSNSTINHDPEAPVETVVVYIVPGFRNPVEFSGTRITVKSRKGPKCVQVEAAIPDISFPEGDQRKAKKIVLDLMLDAIKEVEAYANRNKIIKGELIGARGVIQELWNTWDVSNFHYKIPEGLEYYDLPRVNEFITRVFIEKLPGGGEKHYNLLLDQYGDEVM